MTNAEKYKTAKERTDAFVNFCNSRIVCRNCELEHDRDKDGCRFAWLEREADASNPLPCPCCGGAATVVYLTDGKGEASVQCKFCGLNTLNYATAEEAVSFWNKRYQK